MKRHHVVRPGDCLVSIAASYGLAGSDALRSLAENASLLARRPNHCVLEPGDIVALPERATDGQRYARRRDNRYRVTAPVTELRLRLRVTEPVRYVLSVAGHRFFGVTGPEGEIVHAIDATATQGELLVWPASAPSAERAEGRAIVIPLRIGHLDPISTPRGLQQRLRSLGYDVGAIDGVVGPRTRRAIERFREDAGLATTAGEAELADALTREHGC